MKTRKTCLILGGLAVLVGLRGDAADSYKKTTVQGEISVPAPAAIQAVAVHPTGINAVGSDDSRQLVLTGTLTGGALQDLTGHVTYEAADAKVVRVTAAGRVIPLATGATSITARYGDNKVSIPVKADKMDENLPINFTNHVVPIFTKLGCNSGGCHGKSGGQNGFALSLLGFVPEVDYHALVNENRGRRVLPSAPDNSLLR